MSNGCKLFRVLMFVDEINHMEEIYRNWSSDNKMKELELLSCIFSFGYHILNSFVWASDIGIISKFIYRFNIKWKRTKDMMSLSRNLLQTAISFLTFNEDNLRVKLLRTQLLAKRPTILTKGSNNYEVLCKLIKERRELRFKRIEVFQHILRMLMLVRSLRLPGHTRMSRTFCAVCGMVSSVLSIFKTIAQKPRILKVES
mmetsp:Transcript_12984/g.24104  ORF Transcript_12984/g.24104 Transcript_12984/m.24104 type:complete len:200 (-) Transcript_12984:951-1550(-)